MFTDRDTDMNEIEAAAHDAKRVRAAAEAQGERRGWPVTAIAIGVGVGSAALAAALLYAGSTRKK